MPASDLPSWTPPAQVLDDLALLALGALPGLPGGGSPGFGDPDTGVCLRLPQAVAVQAVRAGAVELTDPEGAPLAVVTVQRTDTFDDGEVGVVGPARVADGVSLERDRPFGRLYVSPADLVRTGNAPALLACDRPPSEADLAQARTGAGERPLVLVALTGDGTPVGLSGPGLVRACLAAAGQLRDARVIAVPLARRPEDRADRALRERVLAAYAGTTPLVLTATGEGPLPPAVAEVTDRERPRGLAQGLVLFFTGLSGSGKSTIARGVLNAVIEQGERTVTLLDGDVVRRHLSAGLTFSPTDRDLNIRRIGWVAAEIARHGGTSVCSPIAPFDRTRRDVRAMAAGAGAAFVLVHVATPLAECERRDRKGLYARARRGEIPDFTGISSPYEPPQDADLRLDTTGRPAAEMVRAVLDLLRARGLMSAG